MTMWRNGAHRIWLPDERRAWRCDRWGPWVLDPELQVVNKDHGTVHTYPIDLRRCRTTGDMLDWIMQVAKGDLGGDMNVAGLVHLFNEVLRPQEHICSGGKSRTMSQRQLDNLMAGWR